MSQPITALVIMGVAGCGKSSVSQALCQLNGATPIEGDAFHPAANIEKMSAGIPLTDEDRYRERLRKAVDGLGFVFLELTPEVAADRVAHRPGHFMPKTLIDSQFATLESPADEPLVLTLNAAQMDIDQLAHAARDWWCEQSVLVTS